MEDPVEQITAPVEETPTSRPIKKDPKKVAAGKALARKNKEAKEAKLKLDGRQQVEGQSQLSSLLDTFRNASILVGSALVLYHGYQAFTKGLRLLETPSTAKRLHPLENPATEDDKMGFVRGGAPYPRKEENSIQME